MFYFIKTPSWLKKIYSACTWHIDTAEKIIYLSFDDGPHPVATPFVLATLRQFNAQATFFCIGKNVAEQPAIFNQIIEEGHAVGNHTYNHLNGWKTSNSQYVANVAEAKKIIDTQLFRPPYGKISFEQIRSLKAQSSPYRIIMWSVLSADFDNTVSNEKCLRNVLRNTGKGSIIVFHDSEKAFAKLQFALPEVLAHFTALGFIFKKL